MNKIKYLKIISYCLLIILGIFMFFYGEYDDSPGGQLLGLVIFIASIIGIIKTKNKISYTNTKNID